jgi:hypothetical protein
MLLNSGALMGFCFFGPFLLTPIVPTEKLAIAKTSSTPAPPATIAADPRRWHVLHNSMLALYHNCAFTNLKVRQVFFGKDMSASIGATIFTLKVANVRL